MVEVKWVEAKEAGQMNKFDKLCCSEQTNLFCKVNPSIRTGYQTQALNGCWTLCVTDLSCRMYEQVVSVR